MQTRRNINYILSCLAPSDGWQKQRKLQLGRYLFCCCVAAVLQTLCSDVKLVLEALTNIPAARQRLIYRGRVLRDDSSLHELGK